MTFSCVDIPLWGLAPEVSHLNLSRRLKKQVLELVLAWFLMER